MRKNSTVAAAVAAILGGISGGWAHAAPPDSLGTSPSAGGAAGTTLQAIIVTAQKYAQNLQTVPFAVQALTGRTLQQLHVQTLSDYLKYVPNVSQSTVGPGSGSLYMRGLSTGQNRFQASASVSPFPNVAVYLDDESAQVPGRNLDIYAVDLQRIEVLEGPQGTLFGAGAQAGVIRYITNKPKLNATEVDVNAGYGIVTHGDPNTNVNGVINVPLLADKLAARVVVFEDHRGGYINNLPATFSRSSSDLGLKAENGGVVPVNSVSINNYAIAANAINPVNYQGIRGEVLYKVNDDWSVLLTEMAQNINAQGVFYDMPYGSGQPRHFSSSGAPIGGAPLPSLSVNLFNPSYDKDRFETTELHVHGKVGLLSIVYAGSYLTRHFEQTGDYTNYARGRYGYYYQCTGVTYSSTTGNPNATCYSPSSVWHDTGRNRQFSQELRLSTPHTWRLRGTLGLYYENYKLYDDTAWLYRTVPQCSPGGANVNCFLPVQTWPGAPSIQPGVRNSSTAFVDDFQRTLIQKAAYGSVSYDIVPHKLTITGGMRYFDMYQSEQGGDVGSFGCKQFTPTTYVGPCTASNGVNVSAQNPHAFVETGHLGRANLTWRITPDVMVYYTYSQGFRPGGFNRGATKTNVLDRNDVSQFLTPKTYKSDILTNNEIGWKTLWFGHRLRFNGAIYNDVWSDVQTTFFCPQCGFGNVAFITNGPRYRVRGAEVQLAARPMAGLTVEGSASVNSGELINSPALIDNNPASVNFGKPITTRYVNGTAVPVRNIFGSRGSDLADSPPLQANLRIRYDHPLGPYLAYVQAGFQHQAHSVSTTGFLEHFSMPPWTTYDASVGVSKGNWTASIVGTNLTNVTKSLFTASPQFIVTEVPIHPRTIEFTFSYHYLSGQ